MHKCAVTSCQKWLPPTSFNARMLENGQLQHRKIVCLTCEANFFSPKNCEPFPCKRGCERGHLAYDRKALEHYKERGSPMLCKTCTDSDKAKDKAREDDLLRRLHLKDSYKCTCRRIPKGMRAYAALNYNMGHKESCKLFPAVSGEKRWDGSNKDVSKADLEWLLQRKRY